MDLGYSRSGWGASGACLAAPAVKDRGAHWPLNTVIALKAGCNRHDTWLPYVKAELGGMRYPRSAIFWSCLWTIWLAKKDFPMGARRRRSAQNATFSTFRGRHLRLHELRIPPKYLITWLGRSADWDPPTFRCR
jgi:hypothetical protein